MRLRASYPTRSFGWLPWLVARSYIARAFWGGKVPARSSRLIFRRAVAASGDPTPTTRARATGGPGRDGPSSAVDGDEGGRPACDMNSAGSAPALCRGSAVRATVPDPLDGVVRRAASASPHRGRAVRRGGQGPHRVPGTLAPRAPALPRYVHTAPHGGVRAIRVKSFSRADEITGRRAGGMQLAPLVRARPLAGASSCHCSSY